MKNFSYTKPEKLKSKKEIDLLFQKGKWLICGDMRIVSLSNSEIFSNKMGVSVAKRNFKKATDRNRIKRLLREVYRHNKNNFAEAFGQNCIAMLFWTGKQLPKNFEETQECFQKLIALKIQKSKKF